MKVIVVGVDGLEMSLVIRWGLKDLLQRYWGTHDALSGIGPDDRLYTPLLWGAFLLGESPSVYGFSYRKLAKEKLKASFGPFYPLYVIRRIIFGKRKLGLRKLAVKLGIYDTRRIRKKILEIERLPDDLLEKTLVHIAKRKGFKVWIKEFPPYNDEKFAEVRAYMCMYFSSGLKERLRLLEEVYAMTEDFFKEAAEALTTNDLVMVYTPLIDYANHMLYRPGKLKLMFHLARYYRRINRLVRELSSKVKEGALLIVSDHGYDPVRHEHSEEGFWSCNIPLNPTPKRITDFKDIILNLLETR